MFSNSVKMILLKFELKFEIEVSKELFFEIEFMMGGFYLELCS